MNIPYLMLAAILKLASPGEADFTSSLLEAASSDTEVVLAEGTYHFYLENAADKHFYVSNHDQPIPRKVFLPLEKKRELKIRGEGKGAKFLFHGSGLAILLRDTKNVTLENISIDWQERTIGEAIITVLDKENQRCEATWIAEPVWETANAMMIWDQDTKSIVPDTGDNCDVYKGRVGDILSYRSWQRPNPAICLYRAENTLLQNFVIHSAWGMGILAQRSSDISIIGGGVYPREGSYCSTLADATHFSNCRGLISSIGATYAGMMDDAINVHSTCLRIVERKNPTTIVAKYMHPQAIGFEVFRPGETLRFIRATTLETGDEVKVKKVVMHSPDLVTITFEPTASGNLPSFSLGDAIENADYQPSVIFRNNVVKNNRARGSLFTTPKRVIVEDNRFENVSGSAILLAGDANGWFESGACEDVQIRRNKFVNCLTSKYQFCEAVITAYPCVPNLEEQSKPYHKNIVVERNVFDCPKKPLQSWLSTGNIIWRDNEIIGEKR